MATPDARYRALKVRGSGLFQATSYWLGPDHLLQVVIANYREQYRRFYFRDIQALVIRRTQWWAWGTAALSVPPLAFFGGALAAPLAAQVAVLAGLGALSLVVLGFHILGGPTCVCRIHTAAQSVELAGIRRWKKARRACRILRPLIESAQPDPGRAAGPAEGSADRSVASPPPAERIGPAAEKPGMEDGHG